MRQLRIVLWLAVIFAGTAFGQGAKTVPAASAPQAQASTQTTVAAMVDRDISAVEKQVVEATEAMPERSEEHTSELQSRLHLVCRLLLEKKRSRAPTTRKPSNAHRGEGSRDARRTRWP